MNGTYLLCVNNYDNGKYLEYNKENVKIRGKNNTVEKKRLGFEKCRSVLRLGQYVHDCIEIIVPSMKYFI